MKIFSNVTSTATAGKERFLRPLGRYRPYISATFLILVFGFIWSFSPYHIFPDKIVTPFLIKVNWVIQKEKPVAEIVRYSPHPNSYDFTPAYSAFGADINRIKELSKGQFREIVLSSVPYSLRKKLALYIDMAFSASMRYKVDPFWILAVMWTESHFNSIARSHKSASGLMQIMPMTGKYLAKIMKFRGVPTRRYVRRLIIAPKSNIEMGVYYLKRLLNRFGGNHVFATVAYNMGPTRVNYWLNNNMEVGVKNKYLDKVTNFYGRLSGKYNFFINNLPYPFENTYVALSKVRSSNLRYNFVDLFCSDLFLVDFDVQLADTNA